MDYASAKDLLEAHATKIRNGHGVVARLDPLCKRLANETKLTYVDKASEGIQLARPAYRIVYFGNPILHFWEGDYFTISDHGWFSHTTHQRLNEYMPRGFSVYGATPSGLDMETRRPLGYIRTPKGTYPYNMPAVFNYDGTPQGVVLTDKAHQAISELRAYTSQYLDTLMARKSFEYPEEDSLQGTLAHSSRRLADAILQRKHYAHLARWAAFGHENVCHQGLMLPEIVSVLLAEGGCAFSRSTTGVATAERMERTIKHRLPMPSISPTWIRQQLRPLINEFVIRTLGFDNVIWNRREQG